MKNHINTPYRWAAQKMGDIGGSMKLIGILFFVFGILFFAALVPAVENKGAEHLSLYGGKTGEVPFPHHQHQKALGDCKICHDIFPQESGSIERLKAQGKLKKKLIMNTQCIKCHKAKKNEGEKTGPTSCKQCHNK